MKKRVVEQTLVVLMACAACVGVTSCGNDSAEPPTPQTPAGAPQAPAPQAQQAPAGQSVSQAPVIQTPATQVPASQEQSAPSTQPSAEPAATVLPAAAVAATFESLVRLAQQPEADYVASARAWAGDNFMHRRDVCDIALRNRRMADLVALTRDARAACSGADATFGNFYAIAVYFKACGSFDEAREALKQARKLVSTKKQVDKVADFLRDMPPPTK